MSMRLYALVVDCHDIAAQARWWAETLDYVIDYEDADEVTIVPRTYQRGAIADPAAFRSQPPSLCFVSVPEDRTVKNRLHIDLAPHRSEDRDAEIRALLDRGATPADVGQTDDATWVVLADPEGNELCVLSSREE